MANEWAVLELYGPNSDGGKRRVTIADGVSISVGAALQMLDPRTASYSHLAKVPIIGIAADEKTPNSGVTEISVFTDGLFDVVASGAITLGQPVVLSLQDNKVQAIQVTDFNSSATNAALLNNLTVSGQMRSYETGSDAEVIAIRLGPL